MIAALRLNRLVVPVTVALMIAGAALTYNAKHDAAGAADRVSELRNQIQQEQVAISLLKAEWSELTQPGRLQDLIARHPDVLALAPFGIDQMVYIRDLPMPPEDNADHIADILTGAIR